MRRVLALLSTCLLTGISVSAPAAEPSAIDKIAAYAGTWQISIEHLDTPLSKASKESSTLRNDCWRSGVYFACNQYVNGDSKVLIVFVYNPKDDSYTSYPIAPGGGPAGS
jgi:hypothetical protein